MSRGRSPAPPEDGADGPAMRAWLRLEAQCDRALAEQLGDVLEAAGALAVTLTDAGDEPVLEPAPGAAPLWSSTRVAGLFDAATDADQVLMHVRSALAPASPPAFSRDVVTERDWISAQGVAPAPLRFGERLWVCPEAASGAPDRVEVLLGPGLGFGSGTHPTTRLCLEWLDANPPAGLRVIDFGCGSGILAIAALRLGARGAWAVDHDPQALAATRDNAARNAVADGIECCSPQALPAVAVEVLVANILARPLIDLAPRFAVLVAPGGRLVLSGVLESQAEEVADAYRPHFVVAPAVTCDTWVRLDGVRRAPAGAPGPGPASFREHQQTVE